MHNHAFSKEKSRVRVEIDWVVSTNNEHDFVLKKFIKKIFSFRLEFGKTFILKIIFSEHFTCHFILILRICQIF